MIRALQLTALTLCTASIAATEPRNLVPNPSFEEADAQGAAVGWTGETAGMTNVTFARDTTAKRTGEAAGRVTVGPAANPSWPALSTRLAVQAGQCYHIEAWVKTRDVARQAYVATDYLDAKGARVAFSSSGQVAGTKDEWTKLTITARIPVGAVAMAVRLIVYGSGTAWFDDVVVARDEHAEALLAALAAPLPTELLARAINAPGDWTRLHRLFQAAAQGGRYTVGVIGGSITQGASASSPANHYAAPVVAWLKEHFPKAEFVFVNAGIGATGTNYGCLRAERDLLSKRPDLVVMEYAVNDGNTQECAETYEGLLRQILAGAKQPAVLLLFMMNQSGGNAQEWQAKVGRHYQLPLLSYRDLLWPEIVAKRMTWRDISPDEVHPNDLGHGYAGKLICALLERALAAVPAAPVAAPAPLPAPLLTDVYQYTRLSEADVLKPLSNNGWTYDATQSWLKCWRSTTPGSVIEFEVSGEQLFLSYFKIRGPMGRARVTIDGARASVQEAWFEATWGGYRNMVKLATGGPGQHRVRIELLADKHPQSTGHEFRLLCLGEAGVRP